MPALERTIIEYNSENLGFNHELDKAASKRWEVTLTKRWNYFYNHIQVYTLELRQLILQVKYVFFAIF